jgi:hypothetical protein
MADARFVPRSKRSIGKVMGTFALVGALAGAGALFIWGCTNDEGSTFKEPNRPFDAATSGTGGSSDAAADGAGGAAGSAATGVGGAAGSGTAAGGAGGEAHDAAADGH